ncbi:MAG: DNA cytosine methyltransferase [Christensenella sp.]|nr:DNA cytosine methyltransferase [Christensenella sp.]
MIIMKKQGQLSPNKKTKKPTVIDLFSGAGGLSLGAVRAGFDVVAAIDNDKNAMKTHSINFPSSKHILADITQLTGANIRKLSGINRAQIWGVIGGPPCQGFSTIGHKNADDSRNKLFVKFFHLVSELQPLFYVAENVPGIMNSKYDHIRDTATNYVRDYINLPPIIVNASEYGAPTIRTRMFFIGYKNDDRILPITTQIIEDSKIPEILKTTSGQALEGLPGDISTLLLNNGEAEVSCDYFEQHNRHIQNSFFFQRVVNCRPSGVGDSTYVERYENQHIVNGCIRTIHTKDVISRFEKLQHGQTDKVSKQTRLSPERFCLTLRAGTGPEKGSFQAVRPIHYQYNRVITPREAARLQGFPDWFKLPNTIWHGFRQVGNSVSPIVAERLLSSIYQRLIL